MLKYGLKSDLIAENSYSFLEEKAKITEEIMIIESRDQARKRFFTTFFNFFDYYLYLQITETPSKQSQTIERIFLSKMANLSSFS